MNEHANWMGRWMTPIYGTHRGFPQVIYAPTLEYAFRLARVQWPTADGWVCDGRQDLLDREVCLSTVEDHRRLRSQ